MSFYMNYPAQYTSTSKYNAYQELGEKIRNQYRESFGSYGYSSCGLEMQAKMNARSPIPSSYSNDIYHHSSNKYNKTQNYGCHTRNYWESTSQDHRTTPSRSFDSHSDNYENYGMEKYVNGSSQETMYSHNGSTKSFGCSSFYGNSGMSVPSESHTNHRRTRNTSMSSQSSAGSLNSPKHPQLLKTTLCDFWAKGQSCRFGRRCWYAHGPDELRLSFENRAMERELQQSINEHKKAKDAVQSPSLAQQRWIEMSQGSGKSYGKTFAKTPSSNMRFKEAVHAQMRAAIEARLMGKQEDSSITEIEEEEEDHSVYDDDLESVLDVMRSTGRKSLSSLSDVSIDSHSTTKSLISNISHLNIIKQVTPSTTAGICDLFSTCGFCPLGSSCAFEHKLPGFSSESAH